MYVPPLDFASSVATRSLAPRLGSLTNATPRLHTVGTAARIVRVERLSTGGFVVVLEGLARISLSLSDFTPPSLPFHETRITLHPPTPLPSTSTTLIESLQEITTTLLATLASSSPLSALLTRRLRSLSLNLSPETAPALVDALMGSIPSNGTTGLTFSDKLTILSLVDPEKRVEHAIEVLGRVNEGLGLKKRIGERVDQSLSRKQREFVLLQQLAAIRQELEELAAKDGGGSALGGAAGRALGGKKVVGGGGEDEDEDEGDDMVELEKAIKAKSWTEESRKVALRELKRLKKSPPQGAEHGVIRTLPPASLLTATRGSLVRSRRQLPRLAPRSPMERLYSSSTLSRLYHRRTRQARCRSLRSRTRQETSLAMARRPPSQTRSVGT